MRIEIPEIEREDGSKFKIVIGIGEYGCNELTWMIVDVLTKEPHKRKWVGYSDKIEDFLRYSSMAYKERNKVMQQKLIDFVGEKEAKKAFQYAYDYIKPDILKER